MIEPAFCRVLRWTRSFPRIGGVLHAVADENNADGFLRQALVDLRVPAFRQDERRVRRVVEVQSVRKLRLR